VPSQAVVHFTEKANTRPKGKKHLQGGTPEAGAPSTTFITPPHHLLKGNQCTREGQYLKYRLTKGGGGFSEAFLLSEMQIGASELAILPPSWRAL